MRQQMLRHHYLFLYLVTILIWGSTWLVITFQLGSVDPIVSVIYRMSLASLVMFALCKVKKIETAASKGDHFLFMLQGTLTFGINFWLIYLSESYLTSGLIAVIFSLILFFNIVNAKIFLGRPIDKLVIAGGLIGLIGLFLLFFPELSGPSLQTDVLTGFLIALTAVLCASLGNMAASKSGLSGHSVWKINAWSTCYGAAALILIAQFSGAEFNFEYTVEYILSLIYLVIFGTILAFGAYLKLMVLIGPERASYGALLIPFVAITLSTIFEGYQWSSIALLGFLLAALGNYLVLKKNI